MVWENSKWLENLSRSKNKKRKIATNTELESEAREQNQPALLKKKKGVSAAWYMCKQLGRNVMSTRRVRME